MTDKKPLAQNASTKPEAAGKPVEVAPTKDGQADAREDIQPTGHYGTNEGGND